MSAILRGRRILLLLLWLVQSYLVIPRSRIERYRNQAAIAKIHRSCLKFTKHAQVIALAGCNQWKSGVSIMKKLDSIITVTCCTYGIEAQRVTLEECLFSVNRFPIWYVSENSCWRHEMETYFDVTRTAMKVGLTLAQRRDDSADVVATLGQPTLFLWWGESTVECLHR